MTVKRIELGDFVWSDERGWSLGFVRAAGMEAAAVGNFHLATIRPGCVRGNHVHPEAREWPVVAGGEAQVAWREGAAGERRIERIETKGAVMFEFGSGTGHAVRNTGQKDLFILAFNDCEKPVTERHEVI